MELSKKYPPRTFFTKELTILVTLLFRAVVSSPICLEGSFNSQARHLLSSQMLTRSEVRKLSTVFADLQGTLRRRWPGSEVIPIGSLVTGLAMKSSDTDCMVKVPYYNIYNETSNKYLILQAVRQLTQQPELYANVTAKFRPHNKISLLIFTHIPTQRPCDVNFIHNKALMISRMVARYYSLDDRARPLAALIKFWSKVHRTKHYGILDSYALNLLLIFYLQQENILPPFYLLQSTLQRQRSGNKINRLRNTMTIYQLLGGFFKYYSGFDFEGYVISPMLGRSIHKREFEDIDRLPQKLSQYKNYMKTSGSKPITLNTAMCVQDVFSQNLNIMQHVSPIHINTFISHVKFAAVMFSYLPSDHFLRTILIADKYHRHSVEMVTIIIDEVGTSKDCANNTNTTVLDYDFIKKPE